MMRLHEASRHKPFRPPSNRSTRWIAEGDVKVLTRRRIGEESVLISINPRRVEAERSFTLVECVNGFYHEICTDEESVLLREVSVESGGEHATAYVAARVAIDV